MKPCTKCEVVKPLSDFYKDKRFTLGVRPDCKVCTRAGVAASVAKHGKKYRPETARASARRDYAKNPERYVFHATMRKRHVKRATPAWANLAALKGIYSNVPEGHHVDHIIPLRGETVSGLHIPGNLQYLPAGENLRKGNNFAQEGRSHL